MLASCLHYHNVGYVKFHLNHHLDVFTLYNEVLDFKPPASKNMLGKHQKGGVMVSLENLG